jgi:ABC-2 type transport system permease protein
MNATATIPAILPEHEMLQPTFLGVLRGEFFKAIRQRLTWIGAVIALGPALLYMFILASISRGHDQIASHPYLFMHQEIERELIIVRVFLGFLLMAVTVQIIGLDYQQGTIRIILARGVSRLELLAAKIMTVLGIAAIILVSYMVILFFGDLVVFSHLAGTTQVFSVFTSGFWYDMQVYFLTVLISAIASIMLAVAATVIGRSVAFGMGVALIFFPADNIGSALLPLLSAATGNNFWINAMDYLLGPNLNVMAAYVVPQLQMTVPGKDGQQVIGMAHAETLGTIPANTLDGTHVLMVTLIYTLVFAVIAGYLTWRRDVQE